jgi:hypothetical protein
MSFRALVGLFLTYTRILDLNFTPGTAGRYVFSTTMPSPTTLGSLSATIGYQNPFTNK